MAADSNDAENFDRLRAHLKVDSLAAVLVHAYRNPGGVTPSDAMKAVVKARIDQAKSDIAGS